MSHDAAGAKPTKPSLVTLCTTKVETVEDVIAIMRAVDGILEPTDGLKWFNLLYLTVTEDVQRELPSQKWFDREWLQRLDIIFAKLYFGALETWISKRELTPHAWQPLFQARQDQKLMRLQFALAGMNAHINRDLCIALVHTAEPKRMFPKRDSGAYIDYCRVNALLEQAETRAVQFLATGVVEIIDQGLGNADNILAMWSVRKAREAAWINAEVLWRLRKLPTLADEFFLRLDRMTGFAGRGLLRTVFPAQSRR
jgi:hypothetical protein